MVLPAETVQSRQRLILNAYSDSISSSDFAMNNTITRLRDLYDRFFTLISYLQSPFLLFVRLYWGWQLVQSGWGKLHHLSNVTEFFTTLNLPMPAQTALAISCLEL